MTIEHKTTHGPHSPGQLAADWMLETGYAARVAGNVWGPPEGRIRLAVPAEDLRLTPESAAALRDALTVHLRNIGWDAPDAPPAAPSLNVEIKNPWVQDVNAPADVVKVAESIRDAYADNSRTMGPGDVAGMTDAEAFGVGELRTGANGCLVDDQGVLYTGGAARVLKAKACRHAEKLEPQAAPEEDQLASPVNPGNGDIFRNTVRNWTDEECRGAWNHAMEDTPKPGRLTDRPSGREYTPLATQTLRARLNEINGADAPR